MTQDDARKTEAFTVWQQHGERAPHFVAERIVTLALADDVPEVERWQQIAIALDDLMRG